MVMEMFGRDAIEKIFADVLGAEDSLVRGQFISGTHALTVALFAFLRPGDTMLSISGKPYDTLDSVIGIEENASSLKAFGVKYEQIDLVDNEFDIETIKNRVKKGNIKLIEIQRSRGYSLRNSITIDKLEEVIKVIKEIDSKIILAIFVYLFLELVLLLFQVLVKLIFLLQVLLSLFFLQYMLHLVQFLLLGF